MRGTLSAWTGLAMILAVIALPLSTTHAKERGSEGVKAESGPIIESAEIEGGYQFTIETTEAPDLTEWARTELVPIVKEWYPKIVALLPSDGFEAPKSFRIKFAADYQGVAATSGTDIVCNPAWYRNELKREALGSVVHELVHVVQQYRGGRPPGWLVEGLADYIRWFLYEPETGGALISPQNAGRARHDGSYRVSANFLNFVIDTYDKDLIKELNQAMRKGLYDPEIWKTRTGKSVETLAEEWKMFLENQKAPR